MNSTKPPLLNNVAPAASWYVKPWEERLAFVTAMMLEMSDVNEANLMVETYGRKMSEVAPWDGRISLSRRNLQYPFVRMTRNSSWEQTINPWKNNDALPIINGGLLADFIYGDKAIIIDELDVPQDDPAYEYLKGMRSACVLPLFDEGDAKNMVILLRKDKAAYDHRVLPEQLWLSNLFGRATKNLVLREELKTAYDKLDQEMKVVADIQRSLLPVELPTIPGLDIAAYYQTSRNAGGDYYDFFLLDDGKLGILIADVSGHGTPAAVMMAVTHSIAHTHHGEPTPPSRLLNFINGHLTKRYTNGNGTFVTAFYGIYDPCTNELMYASAGHNPPRLKRGDGGPNGILDGARHLPLGIDADEQYSDTIQHLSKGDTLVLYTDGITEARHPNSEMYGTDRLDEILNETTSESAQCVIDCTVNSVNNFTSGTLPGDDRTMLVMKLV